MIERGKLVVLEGIDYAGKGTQVKLLEESLLERGVPFTTIDFPRHGQNHYAYVVDRYLEGKCGPLDKVDPYLLTLAYEGDRRLAKPLIDLSLDYGKIVISGRYVSSNKAYGAANLPESERGEFIGWADEVEYYKNQMHREDLIMLLNTPVDVARKRHKSKVDINEENLSFQTKVASVYKKIASTEPNWVTLDAGGKEPTEINKNIMEILDKLNLLPKVTPKEIYFGCSIQGEPGGLKDKKMMVGILQELGHSVLSEMFVSENINLRRGRNLTNDEVYADDIYMMHRAKVKVMDVTRISSGVGYEIGWSLAKGERVIGLCHEERWVNLSKMLNGNSEPNFSLYRWSDEEDVRKILRKELGEVKNG